MNAVMNPVIDHAEHGPLLADIDQVAEYVGISPEMIKTPLNGYCSVREINWLRGIRRHMKSQKSGLLYIGECKDVPVADRMMAMAGALTRNYIESRVLSLQELLSSLRTPGAVNPQVLLVPAFHNDGVDPLKSWQSSALYGLLLSRLRGHHATILQIGSAKGVEDAYGEPIAALLSSHYNTYK